MKIPSSILTTMIGTASSLALTATVAGNIAPAPINEVTAKNSDITFYEITTGAAVTHPTPTPPPCLPKPNRLPCIGCGKG